MNAHTQRHTPPVRTRPKRLVLSAAAAATAIAGLVVAVPASTSVTASVDGETFSGDQVEVDLRWRTCFEEAGPGFECATARVPLDYDRLDAGKIPIEMIRLRATGESQGSLFLNPGGSGGSGVEFVLGAGPVLFTPAVRESYDLIGFDPRGILRSNPLLCFGTLNAAAQALPPAEFPVDEAAQKDFRAANNFLQTQCDNRGGIIQNKMGSANVARDMEVMRHAIGDEQLNFAGYSYGSVLGQVYASLFPDRVGHVIIDGVIDIRDWVGATNPIARDTTTINQRLRSDLGAEDSLAEFYRQCDAAGPDNCLIAPDAEARATAVLERVRAEPVEVFDPQFGGTFIVDEPLLIGTMLGALYSTDAWGFLGFVFADVENAIANSSDGPPVMALRAEFDRIAELTVPRRPDPKYPNFVEGFPGVACVDTSNPPTFRSWAQVADELSAESPNFAEIWTWGDSICAQWPGADRDRFVGPFGVETAAPMLIMSTLYDPATSYQQAQTAQELQPGSVLVTVDGAGHTTLFTSTCADAIVEAYLLADELPAEGTVCAQDRSLPFQPIDPEAADGRQALLRQVGRPG